MPGRRAHLPQRHTSDAARRTDVWGAGSSLPLAFLVLIDTDTVLKYGKKRGSGYSKLNHHLGHPLHPGAGSSPA